MIEPSKSIESARSDLLALTSLKTHRGWEIICETVRNEIVSAALQLADNPLMTEKEIDFRRGAIHAARSTVSALDALIALKENEILLMASDFNQTP